MYRIAVYGKGGIGKSTISANISYGLSERGFRVLHVGCDPKHDSTRLLTSGIPIMTFADGGDIHISDCGVACVECGGAPAGTGCAGKGMSLLFERLSSVDADYRVCDVLGDVVCGGFSVPMREGAVDAIILVTSGEFMSLYAMNNIIRGLGNINRTPCILGIVLNRRGDPDEDARVRAFAESTGLPILADIPRSDVFSRAEAEGRTLLELFPEAEEAIVMERLIDRIAAQGRLHTANPLDDGRMLELVSGKRVSIGSTIAPAKKCTFETFDREQNLSYSDTYVLPSCTSHGAVEASMRLSDVATVLHGPRNCAYLMEYAFRRRMMQMAGPHGTLPPCNIYSTSLDGSASFRGDSPSIESAVRRAVGDGFEHVFIVPTCASEIIGTDLSAEARRLSATLGIDVVAIPADSSFLGSRFGGLRGLMSTLVDRIPVHGKTERGLVNIVSRWFYLLRHDGNMEEVEWILGTMGLRVNMLFLDFQKLSDLSGFCRAEYDVQFGRSNINTSICDRISERTGRRRALVLEPPMGRSECVSWLDSISEYTGIPSENAEDAVSARYFEGIGAIRPRVEGKRVMVFCRSTTDIAWQVETLHDLGMGIMKIVFSKGNVVDHDEIMPDYGDIPVEEDGCIGGFIEDAKRMCPDLVLTNMHNRVASEGFRWCGLSTEEIGIRGAISWARKVAESLRLPTGTGWRGSP